jgi:hypothetical protein
MIAISAFHFDLPALIFSDIAINPEILANMIPVCSSSTFFYDGFYRAIFLNSCYNPLITLNGSCREIQRVFLKKLVKRLFNGMIYNLLRDIKLFCTGLERVRFLNSFNIKPNRAPLIIRSLNGKTTA